MAMSMRLRMIMKEPAVWPAFYAGAMLPAEKIDIAAKTLNSKEDLVRYAWREYASELLQTVEPCQECCESIDEVLEVIRTKNSVRLCRLSEQVCRISSEDGSYHLFLVCGEAEEVFLYFFPVWSALESHNKWTCRIADVLGNRVRLDISEYGPEDAANFILAIMNAHDKVEVSCNKYESRLSV